MQMAFGATADTLLSTSQMPIRKAKGKYWAEIMKKNKLAFGGAQGIVLALEAPHVPAPKAALWGRDEATSRAVGREEQVPYQQPNDDGPQTPRVETL